MTPLFNCCYKLLHKLLGGGWFVVTRLEPYPWRFTRYLCNALHLSGWGIGSPAPTSKPDLSSFQLLHNSLAEMQWHVHLPCSIDVALPAHRRWADPSFLFFMDAHSHLHTSFKNRSDRSIRSAKRSFKVFWEEVGNFWKNLWGKNYSCVCLKVSWFNSQFTNIEKMAEG